MIEIYILSFYQGLVEFSDLKTKQKTDKTFLSWQKESLKEFWAEKQETFHSPSPDLPEGPACFVSAKLHTQPPR